MNDLVSSFPENIESIIEEYDLSVHGNVKRDLTEENYIEGHTNLVGEDVSKLVKPIYSKFGYCVGKGHDILEVLYGNKNRFNQRLNLIQRLESEGRWGVQVAQTMQLNDFKYFMVNYLSEKGIILQKPKKSSIKERTVSKRQNYPILMRALFGEFGEDFFDRPQKYLMDLGIFEKDQFQQTYSMSIFFAQLVKTVDLRKNLDLRVPFSDKLTNDEIITAKHKLVSNSIRIWAFYERALDTMLRRQESYTVLNSIGELKDYMLETLDDSEKIIKNWGTRSQKSEFQGLYYNMMKQKFKN